MRGVLGIWAAATGKDRLWAYWARGVTPLAATKEVVEVAARMADSHVLADLLIGDDKALRIGAAVIIAEIGSPGLWPSAVDGISTKGNDELLLGCVVGAAAKAVDINELGLRVGRWVAGQDPF